MPREKEKHFELRGRRIYLIQTYAADPEAGCLLASHLMARRCPEGSHPYRATVEKDPRGRGLRASVQVFFRENLEPTT